MGKQLIPGGYILLSRKLIDSEIFKKPPLYIKVWVYLLSEAQFKPFNQLQRGQLWATIPKIQEACSWYAGYRKITPTKKQIYSILEWLRNPCEGDNEGNAKGTMIGTTKGTQGMLVTIVNFNVYQNSKNYERNDEGNDEIPMKELRGEEEGNNIKEEGKECKNVEECNKIYSAVVDYLNSKCGTSYKASSTKTKSLIDARVKEDFTLDDFKKVIDVKSAEWLNDAKMVKFLRPETLFSNKFEGYLNQQQKGGGVVGKYGNRIQFSVPEAKRENDGKSLDEEIAELGLI